MRTVNLVAGALAGLVALALPIDRGEANHVQISAQPASTFVAPQTAVTPQTTVTTTTVVPAPVVATPPPATVTVVPATNTVVIPAPSAAIPAQETLRVAQIRGQVVRASTIYANRIEADQVKGIVHHTDGVRVEPSTTGELVGSDVFGSVIYADAISANEVVADHIYVRDLEMSPARFVIAPLQSGVVVRRQAP